MKKIAIFTALMLALSFSSVFAATYSTATDNGVVDLEDTVNTDNPLTLKMSNNVLVQYDAAASGLGYSIAAYHTSGTRTFGSSSGDASIFWFDGTAEDAPTAPTGTESADFSTWTAL